MKRLGVAALVALLAVAGRAEASIRITEWQYNGSEFVEFTNLGAAPVDMTGWSYDDDSAIAGTIPLSAFGVVAPRESVVLSEATAADFRTLWGLDSSVKVVGENSSNLGRNDIINLFDQNGLLVDRLAYGDQTFAGTIRTDMKSGNPSTLAFVGLPANPDDPAQLGAKIAGWVFSGVGDQFGSFTATSGGWIGNPGVFVPEPATLGLAAAGLVAMAIIRRRR